MALGLVAPWHCKILVPGPGVKATSSALQGGLLSTDPPGKSMLSTVSVQKVVAKTGLGWVPQQCL